MRERLSRHPWIVIPTIVLLGVLLIVASSYAGEAIGEWIDRL